MEKKILWDCHMHSSFSSDSQTSMEDMIKQAVSLNMEGITFTEHLDPDYPDTPEKLDFSLDVPAYQQELFRLSDTYRDKINIRFGVELGLQMHLADYFNTLLGEFPFDFVIGSSHVVHGFDPYYPDFFRGRREFSCYMEYFESILENLSVYDNFDVYGHIDYVVRYGPSKNKEYSYGRYQDILDEILKKIIRMGKGIELNTGGYAYGLGEPNPCVGILRRYRQLGGEIITVGADAHVPSRIAGSFDKAACVLAECGYQYYTVFQNRKPEFIRL